jgi:hypothetical protein
MSNKNNNIFESQWLNVFNELCYKVFYNSKEGAALLHHLELKFFRSPTAVPGQDSSWAYFNEGQREMIRMFTVGIQAYMNDANKTDEPKQVKKTRKQGG